MKFERLQSESQVRELIRWHNEHSDFLTLDVETTSVNPRSAKLLDIQVSGTEDNHAVIFDAHYRKPLIELGRNVTLVAHHAKYDLHVLYRHDIDLLSHPFRDTLLLGHLLDENRVSYSLGSYVKEIWSDNFKEKFWSKYKSYEEAPEEEKIKYACQDIFYTSLLYKRQCRDLSDQGTNSSLIEDIHLLQASLLRTEIEGVRVDLPYLEDLGVKIKRRIDELRPEIRGLVEAEISCIELEMWQKEIDKRKTDKGKQGVKRPEFNLDSTFQLQNLLYRKLELPVQTKWDKKNQRKSVSTDADSLERLKPLHPVIPLIIDYRQYPIVYNTFICGTLYKQENGRIYPSFTVNGTVGSRISHSHPNLGNIPASGGIKGIFIPDEGELLGEFDYSQLEVCIEAHLTQDKNLLKIVLEGASKHDITAAALGITRDLAKTLNFAMQYHCTAGKVSKLLGISEKEGERVWKKFWETYPGPMRLKKETDKLIDDGVPLTDLFGRKRRFTVRQRSPWDGDYRSGYNFRVQSPGGQLMNNSFYKANEALRLGRLGKGLWTVHDSGLMSLKKDRVEEASSLVEHFMVNEGVLAKLTVPLTISKRIGMERWLDK